MCSILVRKVQFLRIINRKIIGLQNLDYFVLNLNIDMHFPK